MRLTDRQTAAGAQGKTLKGPQWVRKCHRGSAHQAAAQRTCPWLLHLAGNVRV